MTGTERNKIKIGMQVAVVQKQHQRSGQLTTGTIARILTNSSNHPHGIKVKLSDGTVGRVKEIHE
ncbi:YwbE family protein [Marinicella sp. S1101]|uniref:YwbE family protein n=1 Tax=Marinicella marina TaxID=2996016 RepID=UPI0022608712|nr:YwbE family protein [Marinicella marina]MCX7553747.1 YwbE family protein [Marinicella marina]MDJ1140822.1 YwbE family protein [Marinicella marina]